MKKLRVFETFAGIGAQRKALEILKKSFPNEFDYEVVATSEWDIWANISYNAIHHDNDMSISKNVSNEEVNSLLNKYTLSFDSKKPASKHRIEKLDINTKRLLFSSLKNSNNLGSITEVSAESLLKSTGNKKIDLITYSFPCQDLSVAGSFHGFNKGMKKNSGTRSGLLWEIERIINELFILKRPPEYLLLENVKNMLSSKHKSDYIDWINFLKSKGYNTKTFILNANNYGIPQQRERVYALSILNDDSYFDTWEKTGEIKEIREPPDVSLEKKINVKMSKILKNDYNNEKYYYEAKASIPNRTISRLRMFKYNYLLATKDANKINLINKKNGIWYKKVGEYFFINKCRTITTKQDRHPNAGIIDLTSSSIKRNKSKTKANYRFLTPRETFMLMGFWEEDFEKVICNSEIRKAILYRQAGNSIVVNVLVAIFDYLVNKKWKK